MKEVRIQIPDNCELIKDGDTYIVKEKEKEQRPPRSWEEFCKRYPIKKGEALISANSATSAFAGEVFRDAEFDKNLCTSEEEAEAFLALIQLRQLRKAWVGDWKPVADKLYVAITATIFNRIETWEFLNTSKPLSFPTKEMAEDFFNCFKDLCETAKILL